MRSNRFHFCGLLLSLLWLSGICFGQAPARPLVVINVPILEDWQTGEPVDDLALMARPFGTAEKRYLSGEDSGGGIPLSSYRPDGYAPGDHGWWLTIRDYPGKATWRKKGTGVVRFIEGCRNQVTAADGNSGTVEFDGDGKNFGVSVTGTNPADPFRDFHIIPEGQTGNRIWTPEFTTPYQFADIIRMMSFTRVNNESGAPVLFENRSLPNQIQTRKDKGVCIEYMCKLANLTGKDIWINLPLNTNGSYAKDYATVIKANLDPARKVYVEMSNEVWNPGFPQWRILIDEAKTDPRTTLTDNAGRAWQRLGLRLYDAVLAFRMVLGNDRCYGVAAGQGAIQFKSDGTYSVSTWGVEQALAIVDARYGKGTAAEMFNVLSYAKYYGPDYFTEILPNQTPSSLIASMRQQVTRDQFFIAKEYKALQAKYGIKRVIQYEGGPNVSDTIFHPQTGVRSVVNHAQHIAMMNDPALREVMHLAYEQDASLGIDGSAMFSAPVESWEDGTWGLWGMKPDKKTDTQKYLAYTTLKTGIGSVTPPPVVNPPVIDPQPPTTVPTTKPATNPTTNPASINLKTIIIRFDANGGTKVEGEAR